MKYLDPEMIPENPWRKYSIVDVRCRDSRGRQFLVEMQMLWSPEFKQRVLFNASKAYVRQAEKGDPLIGKAIKEVETSAYTPAQMEGYDKFWDIISVEKSLLRSAEERGLKRGMGRGMQMGIEQGMAKGIEQAKIQYVRKMLAKGFDNETIIELVGVTNEQIEKIKAEG